MKKILILLSLVFLCGVLIAGNGQGGSGNSGTSSNSNQGAQEIDSYDNSMQGSGEKQGNDNEITEQKQEQKTITVETKNNNQFQVSINSSSGMQSFTVKEKVQIKGNEVYIEGMEYPLEVYPSDLIDLENEQIEAELSSKNGKYKYSIKSMDKEYFSGEPVMNLQKQNNLSFSNGVNEFELNGILIEFENVSGPIKLQYKEKEMLILHNQNHTNMSLDGIMVQIKTNLSIKDQQMYCNEKNISIEPLQIQDKLQIKNMTMEMVQEQDQINYKVKLKNQYKVFGIFPMLGEVNIDINAEDGEIIKVEEPWWNGLTTDGIEINEGEYV